MKNRKMMSFVMMVVMMLSLFLAANVFAGPAPGISSYRVDYVGSSDKGWEYISPNQYSTVQNHGGTELYVRTIQYGYDAYTVAKMNGVTCPSAGYETIIDAGNVVIGFKYYWNCSGQQQGQFTATAYSVNTYTPWSTWINVQ